MILFYIIILFPIGISFYSNNIKYGFLYFITLVFLFLNRFNALYGINYFGYYKDGILTICILFIFLYILLIKKLIIPRIVYIISILLIIIYVYTILLGVEYYPKFAYAFIWDVVLLILFIIIYTVKKESKKPYYLVGFIFIMTLFNSIISIISYFKPETFKFLPGFSYETVSYGYSLFGNPVSTTTLNVMILSVTLWKDMKEEYKKLGTLFNMGKALLIFNILLSERRALVIYLTIIAILSIIINFYVIKKNRVKHAITIIIVIIAAIFFMNFISTRGNSRLMSLKYLEIIKEDIRTESAKNAVFISAKNCFMPYGVSNVYERVYESERYFKENFYINKNLIERRGKLLLIQAHSLYEWILVEYGLIYLTLTILILIYWIKKNAQIIKNDKDFINYLNFSVITFFIFFFEPFLLNNLKLTVIFFCILTGNIISYSKIK